MADDRANEEARFQMQRNIDAASQLQSIKANTSGGRTIRVRNMDLAMRPLLHPGDTLEIGGANVMKLRPNDLVYFRPGGDEYRVRKIVRRANDSNDLAFIVCDADGNGEERVVDSQILGVVIAAERRGEVIQFQKGPLSIDTGSVVEKGLSLVQEAYNRISGLFNRKSGG
jgi:hypothetical protein